MISELVTGKIKVFRREGSDLSTDPVSEVDSPRADGRFQAIPVGFDIRPGKRGDIVLMSEARFLTPDFKLREEANVVPQTPKYSWQTGSLSSYVIDDRGMIRNVSSDVLTGERIEGGEIANCWVELSPDGKTVWAANALSSSISTFDVRDDGQAKLRNATAYKSDPELMFFSDLKIDDGGRYLFQLVGNRGEVMVFEVGAKGDLEWRQTLEGLPKLGAYGLASI